MKPLTTYHKWSINFGEIPYTQYYQDSPDLVYEVSVAPPTKQQQAKFKVINTVTSQLVTNELKTISRLPISIQISIIKLSYFQIGSL